MLKKSKKDNKDCFVGPKGGPSRNDDLGHSRQINVIARRETALSSTDEAIFFVTVRRRDTFNTSQDRTGPRSQHDPRFREVAVAWIRKCPHEPGRAGSVDSWTGRLIQIAEQLNVSPLILIRCVPDGVACPRGYVRGIETGAYPLPAWTEDPAQKQTFYDWLGWQFL
jgi:hypothetical protein